MIDIISVVIAITFAIWVYFEVKDTLKTNKKVREECTARIEWYKENMDLTKCVYNFYNIIDDYKPKGDENNEHMDM